MQTDDKEAAIVLGTPNKDFQDVMCKLILAGEPTTHMLHPSSFIIVYAGRTARFAWAFQGSPC